MKRAVATRRIVTAEKPMTHMPSQMLLGFLIPIINTIFIDLSTTAYLMISIFPRLILRLNLLLHYARAR